MAVKKSTRARVAARFERAGRPVKRAGEETKAFRRAYREALASRPAPRAPRPSRPPPPPAAPWLAPPRAPIPPREPRPSYTFADGAAPVDAAQALPPAHMKLGQWKARYEFIDVDGRLQTTEKHFVVRRESLQLRGSLGKLRKMQREMGQRELARRLGVDPRSIRKWLPGPRAKKARVMSQASVAKLNRLLIEMGRKTQPTLSGREAFLQSYYAALRDHYKKFPGATTPKVVGISYVRAKAAGVFGRGR